MKKSLKISIDSVILCFLYFLFYTSLPYFNMHTTFKYVAIAVIAVYLFPKYKYFLNKDYLYVNIFLLLFVAATVFASYTNRSFITSRDTFLTSILFSISLIECFFVMEYEAKKGNIKKVIKIFYYISLLLTFITDVLVFVIGEVDGYYLNGTKFQVVYLHILLIALLFVRYKQGEMIRQKFHFALVFFAILSIIIGVYVDCNTGVIGMFLFFIFNFLISKFPRFFKNPFAYIGVLLLSCSFVFLYEAVLNNSLVQKFVVDVLDRSLTLTGRTNIYIALPMVLLNKLWTGYGYGSSYEISMGNYGYANTQNGLADWVLQIGVIGTTLLLIFILTVLYCGRKTLKKSSAGNSVLAFLYALAILASVEITLNQFFFGALAVIFALSVEKNKVRTVKRLKNNHC